MPEDGSLRPYHSYAWLYRQAGWQGILPLPARKKSPPPTGFTGYDGSWPDDEQIEYWRTTGYPDGNACLRLPPGTNGIDVDQYGDKLGAETIAAYEAQWGPLPPTIRSSAREWPNGIRLFRVPAGMEFRTTLGDPKHGGVEIIQHHHRYVNVFPSYNPKADALYQWYHADGSPWTSVNPPGPEDCAELPQTWIDGLFVEHSDHDSITSEAVNAFYNSCPDYAGQPCSTMRRSSYASRNKFLRREYVGNRHDSGCRYVHDLQHLAAQGHRGIGTALETVHQAYMVAKTTHDPVRETADSESEWKRLVEGPTGVAKVLKKAEKGELVLGDGPCDCDTRTISAGAEFMGEVGHAPTVESPPFEQPDPDSPLSREDQLRAMQRYQDKWLAREIDKLVDRDMAVAEQGYSDADIGLMSTADFLAQDMPETKYRIKDLLPSGGNSILAAQYKSGKTTVVGNLFRALHDGDSFLGRFAVSPLSGTVALIDTEMPDKMLQDWLRDQGITDLSRGVIKTIKGKKASFNIIDSAIRAKWAAELRRLDVEVLIVDNLAPLLTAFGLDENRETGTFTQALDTLKAEAGIREVILVHHMGHTGERSRGDSKLRDWPDAEWRLLRQTDEDGNSDPNAPRYFTAYGRDVEIDETLLSFDEITRHLTLEQGTRKERSTSAARQAVITYLKDNPASTARAVEDNAYEPYGSPSRKAVRDALKALVKHREVTTQPGERRSTLHTYVGRDEDDVSDFFQA